MNIHAPVMLYHKAVLIGLSEFPSFLRYIFSKAAKNAEFNPQKIPKFNFQDIFLKFILEVQNFNC